MFFDYKLFTKGEKATLSNKVEIIGVSGYALEVLGDIIREFGVENGKITKICAYNEIPEGATVEMGEEGYAVITAADATNLYYQTERGLIYAAVTLKQMLEHGEYCFGRLEDAPDCGFRGYRIFLPGRNEMDAFRTVINDMAYYKFNCVSFEIGGAMEYKRHPEINTKWKELADYVRSDPKKGHEIQFGFDWIKDVIHSENADGEILTQDEVREIVKFCKSRGLEVFPEVPTLSHTDYICYAHPELRERAEDPYPNSYCPNHPDTYPLVFDILEEVIDVFEPEYINIGHDEFYDMCLCERCKGKEPYQVFTDDVVKIHDFLAKKGVKTMMWGEELLPVVPQNGRMTGGAGLDYISDINGKHRTCPALFRCQFTLPRDILMIHWYAGFGIQYDYVYHTHGYKAIYGNMTIHGVEEWRRRKELGIDGGLVSNWGPLYSEYMQRNDQYFTLLCAAYAMWNADYDTDKLPEVTGKAFKEGIRQHYGVLGKGKHIKVVHSTAKHIPLAPIWGNGSKIEPELFHMGKYVVTYDDGTEASFDVSYGLNIVNENVVVDGMEMDSGTIEDINDSYAAQVLCYSVIPHRENGKTWCETYFENPHPEKTIVGFKYVSECEDGVTVKSFGTV